MIIEKLVAKKIKEAGHKQVSTWAADCAEHVLHCYEGCAPSDIRPRRAIEAAREWARDEISASEAKVAAFAAHKAADEITDPAAEAAAHSAGHAADTASAIDFAVTAASFAVKAMKHKGKDKEEETWQQQKLLEKE